MSIDIRRVRETDLIAARALVPEGHAEPNWGDAWVIVQDEEIVGVMGAELRLVAEPLYMKPGRVSAALVGMGWLDATLTAIAHKFGLRMFEFFIGDDHPEFQTFVRKHLPVSEGREKKGLYYFRGV